MSEASSTPAPPRSAGSKFVLFIGSNWARTLLGLVIGFVLIPLQLGLFGLVLFGLYILVVNITAAISRPIQVSLTQVLVKSMTKAAASGDPGRETRVFSNIVALAGCGAVALAIVGFALALVASSIIDFPDEHAVHVPTALALQGLILGMLTFRGPWLALFMVEHRPVAFNLDIHLIRWIELAAFGMAVLPVGWDPFLAFLYTRFGLLFLHCVVRMILGHRLVRGARVRISQVRWSEMRSLIRLGAHTTAQPLTSSSFFILDNYLLNLAFGPVLNGLYSVINLLRGYAGRLGAEASIGSEAISADLHEKGRQESIMRILLASMRLVCGLMLISSGIVAIFFGPILDLWLGPRLSHDPDLLAVMTFPEALDLAWVYVLLLLIGGVFMEVGIAGSRVLYGMGLIERYSGLLFASAISKLALSICAALLLMAPWELEFLPTGGDPWGALLLPVVTIGCQVVFFGILFPRRLMRLTGVPLGDYLVQVWVRPIAATAPPIALGAVLVLYIESWTWLHLAVSLLVVGMAFAPLVYLVLLSGSERRRMLAMGRVARGRLLGRRPTQPDGPAQ